MKIRRKGSIGTETPYNVPAQQGVANGLRVGQQTSASDESDQVDVSEAAKNLGQALKLDEFNADRRKRVEELKALVQAGSYNPSSDAVARAVGQEIVLEIMTTKGRITDDEQ